MNFFKKLFNKDEVSIQDVFDALDNFDSDIKTLRNFSEIAFKYFGNNWKFNLEMYIASLPSEYKGKYLSKFKNVMEYEKALSIWTSALQIIKGIKPVSAELLKSMPEYKSYLSKFGIEGERLFEKLNSMFDVSKNTSESQPVQNDIAPVSDDSDVKNDVVEEDVAEANTDTEISVEEVEVEPEEDTQTSTSDTEEKTEIDTKDSVPAEVEVVEEEDVEKEIAPAPAEPASESVEVDASTNEEPENKSDVKGGTDEDEGYDEDDDDASEENLSAENIEYRKQLKERILQKVRDIELRKKNLEAELAEKKAKENLPVAPSPSKEDVVVFEDSVKTKKSVKSSKNKSKNIKNQSNQEVNIDWLLQNFKKIQEFLSKSREIMSAISLYKNSASVEDYKNYGFILDVIDYLIETGEKILSQKSDDEIQTIFEGGRNELRDIINTYKNEKNNEVVIPDEVKNDTNNA